MQGCIFLKACVRDTSGNPKILDVFVDLQDSGRPFRIQDSGRLQEGFRIQEGLQEFLKRSSGIPKKTFRG